MSRAMSVRTCIVTTIAALVMLVIAWGVSTMTKSTAQPIEKREIHTLKTAIQVYEEEYINLPDLGVTDEIKYIESAGPLIETLTGHNARLNPKKIPFYKPPVRRSTQGKSAASPAPAPASPASTDVHDPKGNRYRIHLDWDGDGLILNPKEPGTKISNSVIVYSAGRDGDYSTWEDNYTT
jgi:hypothetical protein